VRSFFSAALPIEYAADVAADTTAPDDAAAGAIEFARVSAAITRLPASLRDVLILRTIDDLSQVETAQILGISEKAVENKLRRARQQLVQILDK
jgi:RNA polymerase sigma-70 factor (ECF subfamily)